MKKILFLAVAMLSIGSSAFGDNENDLSVAPVTLSKGKTALMVNINSGLKYSVCAVKFSITLPDGIEFVKNGSNPENKMGSTFSGTTSFNFSSDNKLTAGIMQSEGIAGSKGLVFAFQIQPKAGYTFTSTDLKGTLSDMQITVLDDPTNDSSPTTFIRPTAKEFDITVTDYDVVLDENSPFAPEDSGEGNVVKVLVKRTFSAGQWSTICLPISLNQNQLKTIFGDNVQLCDIKDYSSEDNYATMCVNFTKVNLSEGLKLNQPYLIYSAKDVIQFEAQDEVYPETLTPIKAFGSGRTAGSFKGSYTADLVLPQNILFISNNQFYYSIGTTRMKAFRCYFDFKKIVTASSRAMISIDGEIIDDGTTSIRNRNFTQTGKVYSVTGRYMGENVDMKSLPKGIYIVDGIKIVNE